MIQNVYKYLSNYSTDPEKIDRLLVSSFLWTNNLEVRQNSFLKAYIIKADSIEHGSLLEFIAEVKVHTDSISIEDLIELFEFVISPSDKEVNGAVYTPRYVREFIVNDTIDRLSRNGKDLTNCKFGDISCGCAGFLYTIIEKLAEQTNQPYTQIIENNIFGLDIKEFSIIRSKLLLSMLALLKGEDTKISFNLYVGNALSFNWNEESLIISENNGFDAIVGNPPYVGATKIDIESKKLLKNWTVTRTGKSDLYIPFFEIGTTFLNSKGILGYITVNTFIRSLNGRGVREYFSKNNFDVSILDFEGEQLFKGRSTYTCICFIEKMDQGAVNYLKVRSDFIKTNESPEYLKKEYAVLDNHKGWLLTDKITTTIIQQIENTGLPLGSLFEIRNGFATLKNDVYVFRPSGESEEYFILEKGNIKYEIEKGICRDAIKPNILKTEEEIPKHTEKLIFPYRLEDDNSNLFNDGLRSLKIIEESVFKADFPKAYKYLKEHSGVLSERDKGEREYEKWYAYGRNQALTYRRFKLLFPYISEAPCFVFTDDRDLLFYNGYAILSNSITELLVIQKILMSAVFWFYIKNASKPYSNNYFSMAKNYVKNFGVCELTEKEENWLLKEQSMNKINRFLIRKYSLEEYSDEIMLNRTVSRTRNQSAPA